MYTKEKHLAIKMHSQKVYRKWQDVVGLKMWIVFLILTASSSSQSIVHFRSWTELRREMQRHSPYGVVVAKDAKKARFKIKDEVFAVYKSKTYEDAFKLIEFADGSVFGIKEE